MTVQEKVKEMKLFRVFSPQLYRDMVNDFLNILQGKDTENIREQFYADKDDQFFIDVLVELGEYDI
jgi:hypothetical protein